MPLRPLRLVVPAALLLTCLPLHATDTSSTIALTSDYVFRGISQSNEHAALQAGMRVDTDVGLSGAVWASRVDFANAPVASAEIDYVIGVRRKLGEDWVDDINATVFTYVGASELNYLEWIATVTWRDRRWIMLGASKKDVFATGHGGIHAQAGLRIPLDDALRIELAGGHHWLDRAYGRDYTPAQATLAWLPHPQVELGLGGHLTDHNARVLFGDLAGPRLEASLQASS